MYRFTQLLQAGAPSTDDGLTFAEMLQSIPVDPASIVSYLLLAGFLGGVVWFGTRSGGSGKAGPPPPAT
jgi:hypothetical protein